MPSALTLLFVMFAVPQVQFAAMLILLALMTIDAVGRKVGPARSSRTESRRLGLTPPASNARLCPDYQVERG